MGNLISYSVMAFLSLVVIIMDAVTGFDWEICLLATMLFSTCIIGIWNEIDNRKK